MHINVGGFCAERQMSREDFVCLLMWEDFVPGGKCPGKILCVSCPGGFFTREDFVPGGGKRAASAPNRPFWEKSARNFKTLKKSRLTQW